MTVFNLYDDAQNTVVVNLAVQLVLQNQQRIASSFAPVQDTTAERIKRSELRIKALGMAPIVDEDATPPIYRPRLRISESFVELININEQTPVEPSLLRKLTMNGSDAESVAERQRAGGDILLRAQALAIRNENRSDWLVMQAILTGKLSAELADIPGQFVEVEYDYLPTHLPVLAGADRWNQPLTAMPVDDLVGDQQLLADDSGEQGINIWLNSNTWRFMRDTKQAHDLTIGPLGQPTVPTREALTKFLNEPDRVQWHVADEGWFPESAGFDVIGAQKRTRWIPDGYYIMTTAIPFQGENLATMWNGPVPKQLDWDKIGFIQGPASQIYVDGQPKVTYWQQASRRLPDIHHPEAIIVRKVY